eukprot:gene19573-25474_t
MADIESKKGEYELVGTNASNQTVIPLHSDSSKGITLEWSHIKYIIPSGANGETKTILNNLHGKASPGELLAIMGTSGAGKSTLLDALAGRLISKGLSGHILSNGQKVDRKKFRREIGYVMQSDALFPLLTVQETIRFAAYLRIHDKTRQEKNVIADEMIKLLRLEHTANTIVGDDLNRGLSGGEKRRVSIGVDIVHRPKVVFLDEPTSGLDSSTALNVIDSLKAISVDTSSTVIMTIHQPSARLFNIIDNVIFLSKGNITYYGPTANVQSFIGKIYSEVGLGVVPFANPPEVFLDLSDSLLEQNKIDVLTSKFIDDSAIATSEKHDDIEEATYANSFVGSSVFFGILIGTLFMNTKATDSGLDHRTAYFVFTLAFYYWTSLEALPIFLAERETFQREYSSGAYRASAYTIASSIVYWPFYLTCAVFYCCITWWLVGLPNKATLFFFHVLLTFTVLICGSSFATMFSVLVPDPMAGQTAGSGKFEWFKISTNPLTRNYFQSISLDKSNTVDWKSFISGWLQATIALRKATPIGFRKSLIETDEWSLETVISNKQAIARLLDNSKDERNEEESNILSNKPSEAIYSIEDDEDEAEERYITICKEIKQEYINNNFYDKSISNEKKWQQDNKIDGNILNIWSTTDEVVPCIISNKRRANTTLSVSKYFELGIQSFRNNKDLQLLFPSSNHIEEPFYFGIDCRSNNEKKLGIFPKTFSLDPVLLTDSDEVNKILETLEPLASSVHLCIIGAGEDYYKWKEANSQTSKNIWQGLLLSKTNSIPSTSSLSISEESNLNSVAMFFMKKSFKHVSVLDGGFTAAAKYLYENQSHNGLISNLVDCDINLLESVLGIQVSHIGTAIASNSANGSYDSKSVSMNSLLSSFNNVTSALLKPLPVSNNQQIHSSSTASENITDPNVVKATPVTESISLTNTKELFTGFSKKLSLFGASSYETIKKSVNTVSTTINNTINDKESNSKNDEGFVLVGKKHSNVIDTQTAFVIDDDEDEDDLDRSDDNTKPIIKDTHGVSIQRTDTERQQALVLHRLAGIRKGDNITITKDYLPGAVLFPCYKLKPVVKSKDLVDQIVDSVTTNEVTSTDINNNSASTEKVNEETLVVPVHRYLVVTKERFMVIDSNGKGVGSEANVKSNHHLTELVKMTFRKKDPELVSLFLQNGDELKSHQYRVPKKQDFLNILQKNMQKFK